MAVKETQKQVSLKEEHVNQPNPPRGRRPNFEKKIEDASLREKQTSAELELARQNQESVKRAHQEIGKCYHPYDLDSGKKQDAETVGEQLESCFEKIEETIAGLSDRCKKHVDKAHRVVAGMIANSAFFYLMIGIYMDNMGLSEVERQLMHDYLIPGFYLKKVARKERDSYRKEIIAGKSKELLSILTDLEGPCAELSDEQIRALKRAAEECAAFFQRSSSCVEGSRLKLSSIEYKSSKIFEAFRQIGGYITVKA